MSLGQQSSATADGRAAARAKVGIRSAVLFKDFGDKFDPTRIQFLHRRGRQGSGLELLFFHAEGMAAMVGLGLPFGALKVGLDARQWTVVEWREEEWKEVWMGTHPEAQQFVPMLVEFPSDCAGADPSTRASFIREEGSRSRQLQPYACPGDFDGVKLQYGSWTDLLTCLLQLHNLQDDGRKPQQQGVDEGGELRGFVDGSREILANHDRQPQAGRQEELVSVSAGEAVMCASNSAANMRDVKVEVIFFAVNGEDVTDNPSPCLASSSCQDIPQPPQQRRILSSIRAFLKARLRRKRNPRSDRSVSSEPSRGSAEDQILESVYECYLKPIFAVTFYSPNAGENLKFQVRVGGEFQLHRITRSHGLFESGCAHENLGVSFEGAAMEAANLRGARPDRSLVEAVALENTTTGTAESTGRETRSEGKVHIGSSGLGVTAGGGRSWTKNTTETDGTEKKGATRQRLTGSSFEVMNNCSNNKLKFSAIHDPPVRTLPFSKFLRLDNKELVIEGDYQVTFDGSQNLSYKLELFRNIYFRGQPEVEIDQDLNQYDQHYAKELILNPAVSVAATENVITWTPCTARNESEACKFIREAVVGEERTRFLKSKHTTKRDIACVQVEVLEKILQEHRCPQPSPNGAHLSAEERRINIVEIVWELREPLRTSRMIN